MEILHQLEIEIMLLIQSIGGWLAGPMEAASMLGYEEFFMLVIPSLYWCFDAALGLRVGIMLMLTNATNSAFKLTFCSPRPYWVDPNIIAHTAETSFGLPSGHAQTAAGMWGLLATAVNQRWAKVVFVFIIFLIGFSRIFLGVHFISDVLTGWLIGGLLLWGFLALEKPVTIWLRKQSYQQMALLAAAGAIVIILIILLPRLALGAWELPAVWQQNALTAFPGNELDPINIDGAFSFAGTWFGLVIGAAYYYHRQGGFNTAGKPAHLLLRYIVGVVGIMIFWYGLGLVFPRGEDALSYILRFVRYSLVGLWVSMLAPLLFERLGIATPKQAQVASLSTTQNPL